MKTKKIDLEIVDAVQKYSGITVSHHYQSRKKYYIHFSVIDNDVLYNLLNFAELFNCAVQIYSMANGLHYVIIIDVSWRKNILSLDKAVAKS